MKHLIFKENLNNKYKIAILIKETSFDFKLIKENYIDPLIKLGINEEDIIALSLKYDSNNKASVKLIKSHLETIYKACNQLNTEILLVADSNYFKKITGLSKAEPYHGSINPSKSDVSMDVILSINYQSLFYNPTLKGRLDLSLNTLVSQIAGTSTQIGQNIIHSEYYPNTYKEIEDTLKDLHSYNSLTCDFETFSLKHYKAGIGTVAFAWNKHEGIAFCVDYKALSEPDEGYYGEESYNASIRYLLKKFFTEYQGKLIWHNISFDVTIAIAQLWMTHITDLEGLYEGLDVMTKNFDCTQIITYLATNSCAGNKLSLKHNAHEFTGNYAQDDITDIRRIAKPDLLRYNLTDCLATWYVYEKNYPILVEDQQEEVYLGLMKDSLITLIQMQLTGMPMCMDGVKKAKAELQAISDDNYNKIMSSNLISKVVDILKLKFLDKDFNDRKSKAKNPDKIKPKLLENITLEFNPNSGTQVAVLLHEVMELPILETTKTGLPATDEDSLKALLNHTTNESYKDLINNILGLNKVSKILNTFIPAFEEAQLGIDGIYYLFGSYKLGGTISGRLSSCLVGESKVQCKDGTIRIDAIQKGTLVPTHTGNLKPVLNVFSNGNRPVYKITTLEGHTLTCTSNHRILTEEGFLSLEDIFNESETQIRQRITGGYGASVERLPQLAIEPSKEKTIWEEFSNSSSLPYIGKRSRTQAKENPFKSTTAARTLRYKSTHRIEDLCRRNRFRYRRNSQTIKSKARNSKSIYKRSARRGEIYRDFFSKKILSKNTFKSKNQSSIAQRNHRTLYRPKRVCISSYSLLDGKGKQVFLRTSNSNVKGFRTKCITQRLGSSPYKRRQNRQQIRQFSPYDSEGTYGTPSRMYSPIIKVDYVGIRRVYDLEIAEDHCYIANGIYVHNSNPNLQNLPSGSTYGKLIKSCFVGNKDWIFSGADFNALESKIDALTTKDPNKLKIFTDGYDSHSYFTRIYWPDKFSNIDISKASEVNTIKKTHESDRSRSKSPTFALQYQGTSYTLQKNSGFSKEEADAIVKRYDDQFEISKQYLHSKLKEASNMGYVTVAFGLRVRTPILKQVIWNSPKMPYEAAEEGRSAGNALSQSYGALTCRAANELRKRIRNSPYKYDIRISSQIHDAIYLIIKNDIDIAHWVNTNLIECMEWQNLPEIQHDQVKLGAELDLFPDWSKPITLPNKATKEEILEICNG